MKNFVLLILLFAFALIGVSCGAPTKAEPVTEEVVVVDSLTIDTTTTADAPFEDDTIVE